MCFVAFAGCGVEGGNDGGLSLFSVLPSPGLISKQHSGETTSVSAAVRYATPNVPWSACQGLVRSRELGSRVWRVVAAL